MDSIRISKVENVVCTKSGRTSSGTVHLTAHHLIFRFDDASIEELWIPYPLMLLVTRLPQTLQGKSPVMFHTRTFESFLLAFNIEAEASDVFDSVKDLTVASSVEKLYAFFYSPSPPLPTNNGWNLFNPREEFGRMGLGTRTKAWRLTDINKDYSFCPTYPAKMVVPTRISDTTLQYACKFRSKARIPVLSYIHWGNFASITRCSQPMVGITQNRSIQDEKLIEAIFQSHLNPDSRASPGTIYGATSTNLIVDARPTANAMANTAKGAGSENMDNYKDCRKVYLGIDNINVMRDSIGKVVDALRDGDSLIVSMSNDMREDMSGLPVLDRMALRKSGWLRHLRAILEGTLLMVKNIHVNSSHVLVHCSDGWDRTAQLSSLAQISLDPYYRTIRGFQVLVEKEWLAYGHKFAERCGHLSSDQYFVSPSDLDGNGGAADALMSFVQNRFASQGHLKETSPVFHQFLECVWNFQRQFPTRFEYNERFLQRVFYHLYSCQFGTFLYDNERERRQKVDGKPLPVEATISLWDFMSSPAEVELNKNPLYDTSPDDPSNRKPGADMGVLFYDTKDIRFWHGLYGRTDEEMNGRISRADVKSPEIVAPVESESQDPVQRGSPLAAAVPLPPSPSPSPAPIRSVTPTPASPTKPPAPVRQDSYRAFSPTNSAVTMRPWASTSSASPSTSASTSQAKGPGTDFLSNGGMKSMWGKLSLNASAAFSVVQEAYTGVSKELMSGTDGSSSSRTQELQSRDGPSSSWGSERDQSGSSFRQPASSPTQGTTSNLDSTTFRTKTSFGNTAPFISADNPWGSVKSPQTSVSASSNLGTLFPNDPTVAHPSQSTPSLDRQTKQAASLGNSSSSSLPTTPAPAANPEPAPKPVADLNADPLGVWAS